MLLFLVVPHSHRLRPTRRMQATRHAGSAAHIFVAQRSPKGPIINMCTYGVGGQTKRKSSELCRAVGLARGKGPWGGGLEPQRQFGSSSSSSGRNRNSATTTATATITIHAGTAPTTAAASAGATVTKYATAIAANTTETDTATRNLQNPFELLSYSKTRVPNLANPLGSRFRRLKILIAQDSEGSRF